ncbi:glutaredoxin domain-containing protein [Streptococcus bovimastitidis]
MIWPFLWHLVLYKLTCPYCSKVKAFLSRKGLSF